MVDNVNQYYDRTSSNYEGTGSMYFYEETEIENVKHQLDKYITFVDQKHLEYNRILKTELSKISNDKEKLKIELEKTKQELNKLKDYISLPWYKKLFKNLKQYERKL